ncbi:hypothetical protein FHX08_004768 [Rhizobium sp. BK529]|uniref:hypothetical protein n=1 Tax=Rhizobium sp. BK529 TaxID=2586983 RepID=UPI00161D6E8B|nr:hypothetical protein [Rhizobium sp. BK529]MBB3594364.1 hypothetical protein [Rhizobium sp. BK529]
MTTVYIRRANGSICELFWAPQVDLDVEERDEADAEVQAFLNPPSLPIASVSSRQFKLQLLSAGLLDAVDAWVAQQSRDVQIAYEYSGTFVKDSPMMKAGFAAMGFSESQIDQFFEAAAAL